MEKILLELANGRIEVNEFIKWLSSFREVYLKFIIRIK